MKKSNLKFRTTVSLAMLSAISIVCGKYLAIGVGEVLRFSLESMPIIFAGMAFGPLAGLIVGTVADIVGCLMVGYTINPMVTVGAAAIGLISGFTPRLLARFELDSRLVSALSVAAAHLIGSVVIKTVGLAVYFTMPFGILMLWRLLNYAIVGTLDGIVVQVLLNNKGVRMHINELRGEKK